jgi:ABC-type dipeptide/oligopeptide/nickel transport system permease component
MKKKLIMRIIMGVLLSPVWVPSFVFGYIIVMVIGQFLVKVIDFVWGNKDWKWDWK